MGLDWKGLLALLSRECDLLGRLVLVLREEQRGLAASELPALRQAAGSKEGLVPELGQLQQRRRQLVAVGAGDAPVPSLRRLLKEAPAEIGGDLRLLARRAADLSEQVFLLNRGNGQMLVQGRELLRERMDHLRYRDGRVTLYGRRGAVSIGGASVIERNL